MLILLFNWVSEIASDVANRVELDQTAPKEQSDQGLQCLHYMSFRISGVITVSAINQ